MESPRPEVQAAPLQRGFVAWTRRIVRIALLAAITTALVVAWFVGLPFTWGSARRKRAWRRIVFQSWARAALWICRVRVEVRGALPLAEPCFFVANHLGYMDILVIASVLDATFVSMNELERWPVFGFMARRFGTIFVDRKRKRDIPEINRQMEAALERSDVVVLFPEGRHSRGTGVLPFRSALLEAAARTQRAVAWGVLHYATGPDDPPAAQSVPWVGVTFKEQVLVLLALGRVDARLEIGADVVRGDDRKRLAEETRARIVAHFEPLESERPSRDQNTQRASRE
jgi:1-acyl-sn-glycerol-3-phosphate acyltransferase